MSQSSAAVHPRGGGAQLGLISIGGAAGSSKTLPEIIRQEPNLQPEIVHNEENSNPKLSKVFLSCLQNSMKSVFLPKLCKKFF